jgi:hypothetical protein
MPPQSFKNVTLNPEGCGARWRTIENNQNLQSNPDRDSFYYSPSTVDYSAAINCPSHCVPSTRLPSRDVTGRMHYCLYLRMHAVRRLAKRDLGG